MSFYNASLRFWSTIISSTKVNDDLRFLVVSDDYIYSFLWTSSLCLRSKSMKSMKSFPCLKCSTLCYLHNCLKVHKSSKKWFILVLSIFIIGWYNVIALLNLILLFLNYSLFLIVDYIFLLAFLCSIFCCLFDFFVMLRGNL